VRWVQPRFRVALAEDGSSNLRRLLKAPPPKAERKEDKPAEEAKTEEAKAVEAKPAEDGKPAEDKATETTVKAPRQKPQPPVSLASFQIVRGAATFTDRSVNPPVTLSVTDLDVRLRGLSNALNARSQVQIKGLVSGGPLEINGILSPRMVNDATDVKVSSKGIDLTPLSPYCGKYAGYALDKGKLDLALEYKVAKRKLAASNSVKIDQFTFGEASNSPDATKLPVKLGLAVLQDPNGLIDLDVPIEGNVDDPNFRLGRVIWRAIGNVLLKAVTSPFNLLAKLVGGGGGAEKMDVVDFQAGTADLTPSADKSLQGLSKALASRPALKVDVEGTADPAADGKTLRLKELKRQAGADRAEKGKKGEMTDEEYVKFVEKRWRSLAPQNQSGTPPDPAAMEDAVLAAVQLPPESLGALRQGRAEAARARLQALGVDPGRLFLTQGGERAKKEGGTRVYFTLK
jgi:flagellar motor protein MotB